MASIPPKTPPTLADALVYDPPGEAGDAHWNEEAKALIGGIILYIAAEEPRDRRTLAPSRMPHPRARRLRAPCSERMQA